MSFFDLRAKIVLPILLLGLFLIFYATREKKSWGARKVASLGIFTAMAIAIGMLEGMLPDLFVPGMKLGLANVVIMLLLYEYSWHEAMVVDILRVIAVTLLRGNIFSMGGFMSLAGAVLSYLGMLLVVLISKRKLSPFFTSILGALLHDLGQIGVGILYLGTSAVIYYLPFMALISLGTGVLSGLICHCIRKSGVIAKQKARYND